MFLISKYLQDKKILSNFSGDKHQIYLNDKNIPLIGGFLLLYPILSLIIEYNLLILFSLLIFTVGFLSDTKMLASPKIRILIQIILILSFVILDEIRIDSSRLDFFDLLLENLFFGYFFSSFCILILINGSNFIDGLNGLLIGYTLIVLFFLHDNGLLLEIGFEKNNIFFILFVLLFSLILNFSNKLMLGDSGAYFIALFLGYVLIKSHNYNTIISPYYFIVLIWYPCFENLFSIIRKFIIRKSPANPDKLHLHHLLFLTFKKKLKLNKIFLNNISSTLINSVNLMILLLSSYDPSNTKYQIIIIFSSILVYILSYLCLLKFNKKFLY
tara:strand:+ start:263 stop:1246 length:984 start_codon:yes stop_codon:yes gene_type:complete